MGGRCEKLICSFITSFGFPLGVAEFLQLLQRCSSEGCGTKAALFTRWRKWAPGDDGAEEEFCARQRLFIATVSNRIHHLSLWLIYLRSDLYRDGNSSASFRAEQLRCGTVYEMVTLKCIADRFLKSNSGQQPGTLTTKENMSDMLLSKAIKYARHKESLGSPGRSGLVGRESSCVLKGC